MTVKETNRRALKVRGIIFPADLATWARKRGLLSVYIEWFPPRGAYPGHWQVLRPGHSTDPEAPAWQRGNKTWTAGSVAEKNTAEDRARFWASAKYDVDDWARIEGLGAALFPDVVARSLRAVIPSLEVRYRRQKAKYKKRSAAR